MIRLGGQGIKPASDDPRDIARAYKAFGYSAAYCPKASLSDKDRIKAIREAFAAENLLIAECNAWGNMIDPVEANRNAMLARVKDALALADEVGARCTVNFIGSFQPNTKHEPHPDNLNRKGFDACVETIRGIVDDVKPRRAKFCLEMMQWTLPDSAEVYAELIRAVDRPAFGVHLDPVNIIISPRIYFDTGALIRKCFQLLGQWIVSCHAKDIILHDKLALHFDEIRLGLGNMDYRAYLTELHRLPREIPLMLEHLPTPDDYAQARDHLVGLAKELNIPLGG